MESKMPTTCSRRFQASFSFFFDWKNLFEDSVELRGITTANAFVVKKKSNGNIGLWTHSSSEICVSWDSYLLKKKSINMREALQTAVYLIPKKHGLKLSKEHCYKVAIYWGSDSRDLLQENTPRLQAYLEKVHSDKTIAPFGSVDLGNGSHRLIKFTAAGRSQSFESCFPRRI
jgi:hypothetical protein